jgi:hypothetical protein
MIFSYRKEQSLTMQQTICPHDSIRNLTDSKLFLATKPITTTSLHLTLAGPTAIYYIVTVAETVFVIPAKAGIQLFRSGPLLPQG